MLSVAIVGGGFSGLMTAYHLIRNTEKPLKVYLFNYLHPSGQGIAYGTNEEIHLLNVPAGKMSALPEDPDHFLNWLKNKGASYNPDSFVPRKLYGGYLLDLLEILKTGNKLEIIEEEVTDIDRRENGFHITSRNKVINADTVVLATGNLLPQDLIDFESDYYIQDPWKFDKIRELSEKNRNLMVIGSGLSMVDVILYLDKIGADVNVTCMSSNGLLPKTHGANGTYPSYMNELNICTSINDFFSVIKKHLQKCEQEGFTKQAVIDVLRPYVHEIWLRLTEEDRQRFLRHLKHGWNVLRHRIPSSASDVLKRWKDKGRLKVIAGKIISTNSGKEGIEVQIKEKKNGELNIASCVLINCTGPLMNYNRVHSTLYKNLFKKELAAPGSLGLGLNANGNGLLLDKNDKIIKDIYTLGPTMKSVLWETTAVNEIRNQAKKIAKTILIEHALID